MKTCPQSGAAQVRLRRAMPYHSVRLAVSQYPLTGVSHGVSVGSMRRIQTNDREIARLFHCGATAKTIAEALDLRDWTVLRRLKAAGLQRPAVTLPERFWSKVKKTDGCWLWMGANDGKGYGVFHYGRRNEIVKAYRFSYELANGPIPDGLEVMHSCDVPACVRPEHLHLGTHGDNMREAFARNRIDNKKRGRTWSARLRNEPELKAKVLANLSRKGNSANLRKGYPAQSRDRQTGRFVKGGQ